MGELPWGWAREWPRPTPGAPLHARACAWKLNWIGRRQSFQRRKMPREEKARSSTELRGKTLGAWGTPLSFFLFSYFLIWLLRTQTTVMQQQTWQHRLLPELIWEGPRILADSYKLSRCKLLHGRRGLQVAVESARIACGRSQKATHEKAICA